MRGVFGFLLAMALSGVFLTIVMVQNDDRGDMYIRGEWVNVRLEGNTVTFTLVLHSPKESIPILLEAKERWLSDHPNARAVGTDAWDPLGFPPPAAAHWLRIAVE